MIWKSLLSLALINQALGYCAYGCDCCVYDGYYYYCEDLSYCLWVLWVCIAIWFVVAGIYAGLYVKRKNQTQQRMRRIFELSNTAQQEMQTRNPNQRNQPPIPRPQGEIIILQQ